MMEEFKIRSVGRGDVDAYLSLVDAHADFEKMDRPSTQARKRLVRDLLRDPPRYEAFLAATQGRDVGYAVTYEAYSSFMACRTLFMEDIFVDSEYRGRGFGRIMFEFLAAESVRRGCGRMEWMVQEWNEGAIRFYERHGGRKVEGWHVFRMEEDALRELVRESDDIEGGAEPRE